MINHDKLIKHIFFDNDKIGKYFTKFRYNKEKYSNIYNYIITRYDDNLESNILLKENLHRIRLGIEHRPVCKTCGNYTNFNLNKKSYLNYCSVSCSLKDPEVKKKQDETKLKKYGSVNNHKKYEKTCIQKYGVNNAAKTEKSKNKALCTNIEKYGYSSPLLNNEVKEKSKITNIKKYGEAIPQKSKVIKDKIITSNKETNIKKYGVDNPMKIQEIVNKQKQTILAKYGVSNISQSSWYKENIKEINNKKNITHQKNNSFNTSNLEKISLDKLKEIFKNVNAYYKSELYPYVSDAYIKDIDTYIEFNYHWTHGKEKYIGSKEQNKIVDLWKSKNTTYYNNAIYTWTIRDPEKLNTAKNNNINLLIFYTYDEFINWTISYKK